MIKKCCILIVGSDHILLQIYRYGIYDIWSDRHRNLPKMTAPLLTSTLKIKETPYQADNFICFQALEQLISTVIR